MISVIMSVYNEKESELREAIDSILNQSYEDFEFIIVLDDPFNVVLKNIIENYAKKDKRITFIINKQNIGLAKSLNEGIKHANNMYIARMDADDVSMPNRFEVQLNLMEQNTDIDVVYSQFIYIDEDGDYIRNSFTNPEDFKKNKKILKIKNVIAHSSVMMKKKAVVEVGGYSEISVVEDYELWLRMVQNSFKIKSINIPLMKVRIREKSMTTSNYYKTYLAVKFIKKYYSKKENQSFPAGELENYLNDNLSGESMKRYNLASNNYEDLLRNWGNLNLIKYFKLIKILFEDIRIFQKIQAAYRVNILRKIW